MNVFDELKALDAKRAELLERAKADALKQAEKAVCDLGPVAEGCIRSRSKALAGVSHIARWTCSAFSRDLMFVKNIQELAKHFATWVGRHGLGDRD